MRLISSSSAAFSFLVSLVGEFEILQLFFGCDEPDRPGLIIEYIQVVQLENVSAACNVFFSYSLN